MNVSILHALSRLQVAARNVEGFDSYTGIRVDDASERIADLRRQMLVDQFDRRRLAYGGLTPHPDWFRDRPAPPAAHERVAVWERTVSVPAELAGLLRELVRRVDAGEPLDREQIAVTLYGSIWRRSLVSKRMGVLKRVLLAQNCGLFIETNIGRSGGDSYLFLKTSFPPVESEEVQEQAS